MVIQQLSNHQKSDNDKAVMCRMKDVRVTRVRKWQNAIWHKGEQENQQVGRQHSDR